MVKTLHDLSIDFSVLEEVEQPEVCKGVIYRAAYDSWVGSDGDINFRHRFRWIKSMSCEGCDQCGWLSEEVDTFLDYDPSNIFDNSDTFENGALYKLEVVGAYKDWESGVVEDYDLGFVRVKDD